MMRSFMKFLQHFCRQQKGIAAIEFALIVPVLITIMYGVVETSRLVMVSQRVEKVSFSLSDIVAQSQNISVSDLDSLLLAAAHQVMQPYDFGEGASVIITAVRRNAGAAQPQIVWQYCSEQDALAFNPSLIGEVGETPTLPPDFIMDEGETVIISEVFYKLATLVQPGIPDFNLYKTAFFKPRIGALNELSGGPGCSIAGT